MDTDLLKTFLEVQRTRHFGKAAENLYLTQSAVSFRIRQLEQQLGVNLFIRHRNNIQLTAAGERLLPHAQTMLAALQRARQDVADSASQSPALHLAMPMVLAEQLLAPTLQQLALLPTPLTIRAECLPKEQISDLLLSQQLDLAMLPEPVKTEELYREAIAQLPLLAVCTPGHAACKQLIAAEYCYVEWGQAFALQHSRDWPQLQAARFSTNSAQLALTQVLAGEVAAFLPESWVKPYLNAGQLVAAAAQRYTLTLYAVCHQDRQQDSLLKAAMALLKRQLGPE